jgi:chemotaxis protein MotB
MPQWIGATAISLAAITGLTGCVSQEQYNALKLQKDRLTEQLANAERESASARAEAEMRRKALDAIAGSGDTKDGLIANLTNQNGSLQAQIEEMNRKYGDAMNRFSTLGAALPVPLTNDLTAFAAANPDLVEFDATRGIVKFKSDLTFAPGSADVKPEAKTAIGRFAQIVNSPNAANYELLVAGHTDNSRVSNPATISAGHKDNWYLSAHRAITVAGELRTHNTSAQRLGVIGYADQRPVASNDNEGGRSRNRRVEVLILPTTVRGGGSNSGGSTANNNTVTPTPTKAPAVKPAMNKDGVAGSSPEPLMNK